MLERSARVLALPLALLTACAPRLPITKQETMSNSLPHTFGTEAPAATVSTESVASEPWRAFIRDPHLVSLIDTALKHNQELNIIDQEIHIASNEWLARRGEYWPKLGLGASGGSEQTERFADEDSNGPTTKARVGLTASWEIDIWKKLRNSAKAAYYRYLSTSEGKKFSTTNLVAEVSQTYFELLALDNQLKIVQSYVAVLTEVREMVELQRQAARATSLAVKRFEAEKLKNESRLFELRQQIAVTENRLNQLLGRFPQPIERDPNAFAAYEFKGLHAAVPTKLLENRPDLAKAKFNLEASKLDVNAARARFYPALSIDGSVGYEHFNSKHFEKPLTALFYDVTAGLTAPLLNRRAIKADYFTANNKQIQAVYEFEQTLIRAFTDVANQLITLKNLDASYALKHRQVKVLLDAVQTSNTLFRAARVDYVESLLTRRDALDAEIELVEVKKRQLAASVDLYRALGGGWREAATKVSAKN